jgi:hypothetical protein
VDPWLVRFQRSSIFNAGGNKSHCGHPSRLEAIIASKNFVCRTLPGDSFRRINFLFLDCGVCAHGRWELQKQPLGSGLTDKQLCLSIRGNLTLSRVWLA